MSKDNLDSLYSQAQKAIQSGETGQARELLKQILTIDEDFRDAAQLLASLTDKENSQWYTNWKLWAGFGAVIVIALISIWAVQNSQVEDSAFTQPTDIPTSTSIQIPTATQTSPPPTSTPVPTPTPLPLYWTMVSSGEFLSRDIITVIVQDPNDPDILYAGTRNAGIYKTLDEGISWQPINKGLERAYIISIAIDPEDTDTLYSAVSLGGVYKSTDGGASWQASNQGIDDFGWEYVSQVVIDPQNHAHLLYQAVNNGLYESFDKGANWSQLLSEGKCPYEVSAALFSPQDSQTLLVLGNWGGPCKNGLYTSSDGGQTWMFTPTDIKSGVQAANLGQDSNGRLLLSVNHWQEISLLVSENNGATWDAISTSTPEYSCVNFLPILSQASTFLCLTGHDLQKSTNDGKTWRRIFEIPSGGMSQHFGVLWNILVPPDDPDKIFVGWNGLFLSSNGGRTWSERSSGLGAARLEFVFRPGSGNLYIEDKGTGFLYESADGGHTWVLFADRGNHVAFDASGGVLYRIYGRDYRNFLITRKAGSNWWAEYNLPPSYDNHPRSIAAHPSESGLIYVNYSGGAPPYIYYSIDGGLIWISAEGAKGWESSKFFFDPQNPRIIYFAEYTEIFKSADKGETWDSCSHTGEKFSGFDSGMVIDPRDSDHMYLATHGGGVLVSKDGCQSWHESNRGLENLFVNTLAIDFDNPATIYAGTNNGIYISYDSGQTWGAANDGLLGGLVIYSIMVDPQDSSNVYAATPLGIFKLEGN